MRTSTVLYRPVRASSRASLVDNSIRQGRLGDLNVQALTIDAPLSRALDSNSNLSWDLKALVRRAIVFHNKHDGDTFGTARCFVCVMLSSGK
jgi:hypothetical protein